MNNTDLYSLPKDILIKLITTISEQNKEEFEKTLEDRPLETWDCDVCGNSFVLTHDWQFPYSDPICKYCYNEIKDKTNHEKQLIRNQIAQKQHEMKKNRPCNRKNCGPKNRYGCIYHEQ